jgi:hypothetical protein
VQDTLSDVQGRFAFQTVPAGGYRVSAAKAGLVTLEYGADRSGVVGATLKVQPDSVVTVILTLESGAAISGSVNDGTGAPLPACLVLAFEISNDRTILLAPALRTVTNSRGQYRFFGLPRGFFLVAAMPKQHGVDTVTQMGDREVASVLNELSRVTTSATPHMFREPQAERVTSSLSYAPTFSPSGTSSTDAQILSLSTGEERRGVDVTVQPLPLPVLDGSVTDDSGGAVGPVQVTIVAIDPIMAVLAQPRLTSPPSTTGQFHVQGVVPGEYEIVASTVPHLASPGLSTSAERSEHHGSVLSGRTIVSVEPSGTAIHITVRAGHRVAGRVRNASQSIDRVTLTPWSGSRRILDVRSRRVSELSSSDGFNFDDVPDGDYVVGVGDRNGPANDWTVGSMAMSGQHIESNVLRLSSASPTNLPVDATVVRMAANIEGQLVQPSKARFVLVFPLLRERRDPPLPDVVKLVQVGVDGNFVMRGLPLGKYLLAFLDGPAAGGVTELNPGRFVRLEEGAMSVTIAEPEETVRLGQIAGK